MSLKSPGVPPAPAPGTSSFTSDREGKVGFVFARDVLGILALRHVRTFASFSVITADNEILWIDLTVLPGLP